MNQAITIFLAIGFLYACQPTTNETSNTSEMKKYAQDSHSFSNPNAVAATHLDLDIAVDFENRMIFGSATYDLERQEGDEVLFDLSKITVEEVKDPDSGNALNYEVIEGNEYGDKLSIQLGEETQKVEITYKTSPEAAALLWMDPAQTNDGKAPFLFTQGQAILTRSWIPIQDSPALRMTYTAEVKVPEGTMALMSAENPTERNDSNSYSFTMDQPIPPYLMALAVGDLEFSALGERTGVYAEPGMLEASAYEFEDMERMLETAEELYGPYQWDRYDVLVLPPGFPFGGMENPRLTFATPTIIAGDRSLTSLIAHELAHSWSGNLVTNATWNDFWLNEGFTVYFEKRIMEALYGKDYASMLNELGYQDLQHTIDELGSESADTHLKLNLENRDPDDGMTDIAYEKGYLFLRWLESLVGRERFDTFLKSYFEENAFQTMTTESFINYLETHLLNELETRPDIEAWIYQPGLPEGHPQPESTRFDRVDSLRTAWLSGELTANELPAENWTTHEWLHFLRGLPEGMEKGKLTSLDEAYGLTETGNSEIAAAWFEVSIENKYQEAFPQLKQFLIRVGRRKFLKPLYEELAKTEENKSWAREVYKEARPNYHAVSSNTIDEILDW